MNIACDRCMKKLFAPGGLAFSPPMYDMGVVKGGLLVGKTHLCGECWSEFRNWVDARRAAATAALLKGDLQNEDG